MARIDLHAHVITDVYRAALPAPPDGSRPMLPPASLEQLLETMDRYSIDAAVISTGPPGAASPDPGQSIELARLANEEIAACVRSMPQRLGGLAVLPLPDVDAALTELAHALDVLRLDGILLMSNVGGVYLGDPAWERLFAELDRRAAYVFVHPALPPYAQPLPWPVWLYEFPFDTTRAIVQMIYSGTLERFPQIRIQLSHLGGTAPFLAHRIGSLAEREPQLAERAPAGALGYLSRLWYDTGLSNNDGGPGLDPGRRAARARGVRHGLAVCGSPPDRRRSRSGPRARRSRSRAGGRPQRRCARPLARAERRAPMILDPSRPALSNSDGPTVAIAMRSSAGSWSGSMLLIAASAV